jgi:FtsP/CotA-like multicopper oxidase with cupredoxin domain
LTTTPAETHTRGNAFSPKFLNSALAEHPPEAVCFSGVFLEKKNRFDGPASGTGGARPRAFHRPPAVRRAGPCVKSVRGIDAAHPGRCARPTIPSRRRIMHPAAGPSSVRSHRRAAPAAAVASAALAALLAAGCGEKKPAATTATEDASLRAGPTASNTLREPLLIRSNPATHILDVTLAALDTSGLVGQGKDTLFTYRLLAANGVSYQDSASATGMPGPTFLVHPGDSVRLLLLNQLPANPATGDTACQSYQASSENPPVDTFPDCFHGPNSTNIHYHGFHVTPDSNGDDVLLTIQPGGQHQYAFRIPLTQSPGTHWYHPHKHGSVALQVTNGMSGAFIVQDTTTGLDSITTGLHIVEHVLAVQQIRKTPNLMKTAPNPQRTLVNGQSTPHIVMHPGEVQRWRIVDENINPAAQFSIGFDSAVGAPTVWGVARDGVTFDSANYSVGSPNAVLTMGPGNRLDVLVKAGTVLGPQILRIRPQPATPTLRQSRQVRERPSGRTLLQAVEAVTGSAQGLVVVDVVSGAAPDTVVPATLPTLPAFLANLPAPSDTTPAVVVFTDTLPPAQNNAPTAKSPTRFFLGSAVSPYMRYSDSVYIPRSDSGRYMPMVLGQIQDWRIENHGRGINHPFHIHINPFQVLSLQYGSTDPNAQLYAELQAAATGGHPIWLDVLPLPVPYQNGSGQTVPGSVHIRQQYKQFTGQFVMHCHILGHEERGMMQLLEVFPSAAAATARPRAAPHSHH